MLHRLCLIVSIVLVHSDAAAAAAARKESGSMVSMSDRVRRSNIIQVTEEGCNDCVTMDMFIRDNEWTLLLFYRLPTRGANRYIWAMKDNVEQACERYAFGRIACGRIDVYIDRKYPLQFNIDPNTVPAIVILHRGIPQDVTRKQIEDLMHEKTPDSVVRYIRQQMSPIRPEFITRIVSAKSFRREITRNDIVIVGLLSSSEQTTLFRKAVQTVILTTETPTMFINPGRDMRREEIRFLQIGHDNLAHEVGHSMNSLWVWITGVDVDMRGWKCSDNTIKETNKKLRTVNDWEDAISKVIKCARIDFSRLRPLPPPNDNSAAGGAEL